MSTSLFESWREQVAIEMEPAKSMDAAKSRPSSLQRWLEGYGLPRIDSYTEGYIRLLEAVSTMGDPLAHRLASVAGELLQLHSKRGLQSTNLERLLLNLFYLCAGLRRPSILWMPLLNILEDKNVPARDYRGVPLVMAFRAALAENQGDARLERVWRGMLGETAILQAQPVVDLAGKLRFLDGGLMDGFEGFLGMPGMSQPGAIGRALASMSYHLESSSFRDDQFLGLVESVKKRFNAGAWNWKRLSTKFKWRPWAQELVGGPELIRVLYTQLDQVRYYSRNVRSVQETTVEIPVQYAAGTPEKQSRQKTGVEDFVLDYYETDLQVELLEKHIRQFINKPWQTYVPGPVALV